MNVLSLVILCLRVLVAAVFIAYAASKLQNPSSFAAVIRSHRLIPDSLSSFTAWTLIVVEMAAGVLFLFNVFPLLTGIAIGALLILFSGVLLRARFTDQLNVENCGCSGAINQKATIGRALFRNGVLLCILIPVVITTAVSGSISSRLSPVVEVATLVCVFAGVVFWQTELLSPILHLLKAKTVRNQGEVSSVLTTRSNRRSFIGWSMKLGIGVLVGAISDGALKAFAYVCNCRCGPTGSGPGNCYNTWDCTGQAGHYVTIFWVCDFYCCKPAPPNYCDSTATPNGQYYCPPTC